MNRLFALLTGLGFVFFMAGNSNADLFSSTVNLSESGTSHDQEYLELSGSGDPYIFSITQNTAFPTSAAAATSAQIVLTHRGNSNKPGELWFLYANESSLVGQLWNSTKGDDWVEQVFTIPAEVYSQVSGGSWTLQLKLLENTTGTDKLQIA